MPKSDTFELERREAGNIIAFPELGGLPFFKTAVSSITRTASVPPTSLSG
jgi:hypothetical protein